MGTVITASDARQLIAIHDPLLARSLTDDQALAVVQALQDARWSGTVSGAFWLFVIGLLGYYGFKWVGKNTDLLRL